MTKDHKYPEEVKMENINKTLRYYEDKIEFNTKTGMLKVNGVIIPNVRVRGRKIG